MEHAKITESQYQLLAARRQNYDAMLWQTPVISLTAQAFLFTIALGTGPVFARMLAAFLALVSALASAHLLAKHRYLERHYSELLQACEDARQLEPVHRQPPRADGLLGLSAYRVWKWVFGIFAAAAFGVGLTAGLELWAPAAATAAPSAATIQLPQK